MRAAIVAHAGFNRGTPAAIAQAGLALLGSGGSVQIIERYPDPYSLTIIYTGNDGSLSYSQLAAEKPLYSEIPVAGTPVGTPGYPTYNTFPAPTQTTVGAALQAAVPAGLVATVIT
jgi:hypothetical protein